MNKDLHRDKKVTRYIRHIFWQATVKSKKYFLLTLILYPIAFFLINIIIPVEIAYSIQAIVTKHFSLVGHYAFLIILITVIANIINATGTWAFNRHGIIGAKYIQNLIFNNYLSKDYEFYSNNYVGALGTQASNLRDAFIAYQLITLLEIPRISVIIFASLAVLAIASPPLALISLVCMLLVFSFTIVTSGYRLRYRRQVSEASSALASILGDSLSHATVVKSFSNEGYESKLLNSKLKIWHKAQLKSWDLFTPVNFGRHVLLAITMSILIIVSARLYQAGAISIAIITLVQLYVIRLIYTTLDAANLIKQYEAIMSSAYQPAATMLVEPQVKDAAEPRNLITSNALEIVFDNVTYSYPEMLNGNTAIKDFSLIIKSGQKVGLVGYSGGGKTTITKLLLRFMDVNSGSIKINGIDLRDLAQAELRQTIAYVPQEPLLFHRSIGDNIAYARPTATNKDIELAAKLAYVDEFVKELPHTYDTMVGERGVKLSGGQRQRVAIARALLRNSPILVLDEATSSLDSQSEHYIQKALSSLMEHRTSIVVAHRLSTIQNMDVIVVMDKGKIVDIGSHKELLSKPESIYAKLWEHQSGGYIN